MRQQFKALRQLLSNDEREQNAILAQQHCLASPEFLRAKHIACYFSVRDELDTAALFAACWRAGKNCYVPVIDEATKAMRFAHYVKETPLVANRYGILEPIAPQFKDNHLLDLVLVPLLAFDQKGFRLGMGGGFYDRSFAFLLPLKRPAQPILLGLAFSKQQAHDVYPDDWDVPLDGVITEKQLTWFHSS